MGTQKRIVSYVAVKTMIVMLCGNAVVNAQSINEAEVVLLNDSMSSDSWSNYGYALLSERCENAEWSFRRALHIDQANIDARRGIALITAMNGNTNEALDLLRSLKDQDQLSAYAYHSILLSMGCPYDPNSQAQLNHDEQQSLFSGISLLLECRSNRLNSDTLAAVARVTELLGDSGNARLMPLIRYESYLLGLMDLPNIEEELEEILCIDRMYMGSVYASEVANDISSPPNTCLTQIARYYQATGNDEAALANVFSAVESEHLSLEDKLWSARVMLDEYRYNEASEVVESILRDDSTIAHAWCIKAVIMMRNGMYYETYEMLESVHNKIGMVPECVALQGLAAEFNGESRLAAEAYAPLLSMSADSVVLINRMRSYVCDEGLNYNFDYVDYNDFTSTRTNWLTGTISLSYSNSTGEFEQSDIGASLSLAHKYGLFGSYVEGTAYYSRKKWEDVENISEAMFSSLTERHQFNSAIFMSTSVLWNYSRYDVSRWETGVTSSIGYKKEFMNASSVTVEGGFGRHLNKWNSEGEYEASWMGQCSINSFISGRRQHNYLPDLSVGISASRDLETPGRYDLYGVMNLTYALSRVLSLSSGYSVEYRSALPPDFEDVLNTTTTMSVNLRF